MQHSTNYGFRLPEQSEPYNVDDQNYNSLKADAAMKIIEDKADAAGNITPEDIGAATVKNILATIPAAGWIGSGPYTNEITVAEIAEDMTPIIDLIVSDDAETAMAELESWRYVGRIDTGAGILAATCYEDVPGVDLNIIVKVVK